MPDAGRLRAYKQNCSQLKTKGKVGWPESSPSRAQVKKKQGLYNMENTKSRFNCKQWSYTAASTIQLSKLSQMQYLSSLSPKCSVVPFSVVLWCSIPDESFQVKGKHRTLKVETWMGGLLWCCRHSLFVSFKFNFLKLKKCVSYDTGRWWQVYYHIHVGAPRHAGYFAHHCSCKWTY